ncbi:MAG: hypothetical protein WBA85_03900 [Brucella anthropi]
MIADNQALYYRKNKVTFYINLSNATIGCIMNGKKPDHIRADIVRKLHATHDKTHFDRETETLYLDALALVDLMALIQHRMPNATPKVRHKAFDRLFSGGYADVLTSTSRAAARAGLDLNAPGEESYFKKLAIDAHPIEFSALQRGENASTLIGDW